MKADIIYTHGLNHAYVRAREAEIARSGKTIFFYDKTDGSKVSTYVWGCAHLAGAEARAEAGAINTAQKALDIRRRQLNARLIATQATLIAAAKLAPATPKSAEVPIVLTPDML